MAGEAEKLHELAQSESDTFGPDEERGPYALTGAILISEWMDINGREWFTYVSTEARGEIMPAWRIRGFLEEVRHAQDVRGIEAVIEGDDEDDD